VGVTAAERADPQRVTVSLRLIPLRRLEGLNDDIANTIDYFSVREDVLAVAGSKSRSLIETIADEIAAFLLMRYPLLSVEVEVRKYILTDAEYVGVHVYRERAF
jgi:FolB domain-containing protein